MTNTTTRFGKIAKYVSQLLLTESKMTADVNYIFQEVAKIWAETSLIPNEQLEKRFVTQVISQMKRQEIITLVSKDGRNNTYKVSNEELMRQIESGDHELKQLNKQSIIQLKKPKKTEPEKPVKEDSQLSTPYADKIRDLPLSPLEIGMGVCELVGEQNDKINQDSAMIKSLNDEIELIKDDHEKRGDTIVELNAYIKELELKISKDAKQYAAKEQQLNNQIGRLTEINSEKDKEIENLKFQPEIQLSTMSQLSSQHNHK